MCNSSVADSTSRVNACSRSTRLPFSLDSVTSMIVPRPFLTYTAPLGTCFALEGRANGWIRLPGQNVLFSVPCEHDGTLLVAGLVVPRRSRLVVTKTPARAGRGRTGRSSTGRIVSLFRPYRLQVSLVIVLIVVTSTIGIINPLLIQAVFNKALFVPGGPDLHLLYVLGGVMALGPGVHGAIGILQVYETTRGGQQVMRDLRNRLYTHLETLPLSFFTNTKTGEIQSRLAHDGGGVETVGTNT